MKVKFFIVILKITCWLWILLPVKVTKTKDSLCWEVHWVNSSFSMGTADTASVFLKMQTDCESVISSSLCSVNRGHQEAVRLLKSSECWGQRSTAKVWKIHKRSHPLLIRVGLFLEGIVLQWGPFTVSCRKGLRAPEVPTETLRCCSRSTPCIP